MISTGVLCLCFSLRKSVFLCFQWSHISTSWITDFCLSFSLSPLLISYSVFLLLDIFSINKIVSFACREHSVQSPLRKANWSPQSNRKTPKKYLYKKGCYLFCVHYFEPKLWRACVCVRECFFFFEFDNVRIVRRLPLNCAAIERKSHTKIRHEAKMKSAHTVSFFFHFVRCTTTL